MKTVVATLMLSLSLLATGAQAKVRFVGRLGTLDEAAERPRTLVFMTSEQMASKVQALTGFYQPGFEDFARILGTFDSKIGTRTNDHPTVLTVLILEGLMQEVASSVVAREIFLDDADRLVFPGVDLSQAVSEERLRGFTQGLCDAWFHLPCPVAFEDAMLSAYVSTEGADVSQRWESYLNLFLQNGALYYL